MLEALITGERDVEVIAEMALTRMRPKIPELQLALESRFDDHNASMVPMHFTHIDHLSAAIDRLDRQVERELTPLVEQVGRLCTMPGIGQRTAVVVIAEIGVDNVPVPDCWPSGVVGRVVSWSSRVLKRPGSDGDSGRFISLEPAA